MDLLKTTIVSVLAVFLSSCLPSDSKDSVSSESFPVDAPVRVGVDVPYQPFSYTSSTGELTGIEIEFGNRLCLEISGEECEWVVTAWDQIISELQNDSFDLIISSMAITDARQIQIDFSDAYFRIPWGFAQLSGSVFDASKLADYDIGVVRGTVSESYLNSLSLPSIVSYTTFNDLKTALAAGNVDVAFESASVLSDNILDVAEFTGDFMFEPTSYFGEGVGVGVRKDENALLNAVNQALADLLEQDVLSDIAEKYISYPISL